MAKRTAIIKRDTTETTVKVELNVDGRGDYRINTGLRMFDHMLSQLAKHGIFDMNISASGDNPHHVVEDVGICLGEAFRRSLGERQGIVRMSHAVVPMDESLSMVAIDVGGRGYAVVETSFTGESIAGLPVDLVRHFLETFAIEAKINIHAKVMAGINDHHKAEALFKALARALDDATRIDERIKGRVPSTKGEPETEDDSS